MGIDTVTTPPSPACGASQLKPRMTRNVLHARAQKPGNGPLQDNSNNKKKTTEKGTAPSAAIGTATATATTATGAVVATAAADATD